MKILLLEDEHLLNNNIKEFLVLKGLSVESYVNGSDLLEKSSLKADLAILDIGVPGATGYEVIEWIKRVDETIPTIFITAYHDISHIEQAYELGCSDYLKKPFDLVELWLRVQQLIDINYHLKVTLTSDLIFDMEHEQLYYKNDVYKLTKIQRKILKTLIKYKNSIVTYEILIDEIWNDGFIKVNTIASHIKEIRKILPKSMIESMRAEGYVLHL